MPSFLQTSLELVASYFTTMLRSVETTCTDAMSLLYHTCFILFEPKVGKEGGGRINAAPRFVVSGLIADSLLGYIVTLG